MRSSERLKPWPPLDGAELELVIAKHLVDLARHGVEPERQEIDWSNAPIAPFTERFGRWVGWRGIGKYGSQDRTQARRNDGLIVHDHKFPVREHAAATE